MKKIVHNLFIILRWPTSPSIMIRIPSYVCINHQSSLLNDVRLFAWESFHNIPTTYLSIDFPNQLPHHNIHSTHKRITTTMSFMKYLFCENDSSQLLSWNNITKLKLVNVNALKLRLLVCFWSYFNIVVNFNWRRFNIRNLCQAKVEFHVLSTIALFIWCTFAHILDSFANMLQNYINIHILNFHGLNPLFILSLHCIHSHWGNGAKVEWSRCKQSCY